MLNLNNVSLKKVIEELNALKPDTINTPDGKVVETGNINYTTMSRAMRAPIAGAVYDPEAINLDAVNAYLFQFGLDTSVFDDMEDEDYQSERQAREIVFGYGDVWTHRNYTHDALNESGEVIMEEYTTADGSPDTRKMQIRDELKMLAWDGDERNGFVTVKNLTANTVHTMTVKTFRQGAPEPVRTASYGEYYDFIMSHIKALSLIDIASLRDIIEVCGDMLNAE